MIYLKLALATIIVLTGFVFLDYKMTESKIEQFANNCLPVDDGQKATIIIKNGMYQCHIQAIKNI